MTVYFSTQLQRLHPRIAITCLETLCENRIDVGFIETGDNLWVRDFLPVKTAEGLTQFKYRTVGWNKFSALRLPLDFYVGKSPLFAKPNFSEIILDGGNVVQNASRVIMTNKVLKQNCKLGVGWLRDQFESKIFRDKRSITFIPGEPGDDLCHADGIVHFIDGNRAFVNDYCQKTRAEADYQDKVCDLLIKDGIEPVLLPNARYNTPEMSEKQFRRKYPHADDFNPGVGYYINMLTVSNVVLLPVFGFAEDAEVIKIVNREFPDHVVKPINCFSLAMMGGLLHCVSWVD